MKALAMGAVIDALRARTARERSKTDVARWLTLNASTNRNLPDLPPTEGDSEIGVAYAIANQESTQANRPEPSGATAATASTSDSANRSGSQATAATQAANRGVEGANGGTAGTAPGGSGEVAAAPRQSSAIGALPWKLIGSLLLAMAGGGGLTAGMNWMFGGDDNSQPPAVVVEGEYPLLDWLREKGYHMPENE